MNNLETLEDLKNDLIDKLENEFKDFDTEQQMQEIHKILTQYDLSDDEYEYAHPIKISFDSASHQYTMINANEAKAILLERKSK